MPFRLILITTITDILTTLKHDEHQTNDMLRLLAAMCTSSFAQDQEEWKLVWSDEFNINGRPDSTVWNYEIGFQRNHEDQWYQPANAYCKGGCLVIEAKKEKKERKNPGYDKNSQRWPQNVENIRYTSALLNTAQKKEFLYGRVEVRAKSLPHREPGLLFGS